MIRVALTGGIATGKSYCLRRFAELGVPAIDADRLARDAVAPGTPGLAAVAARFGGGIIAADGSLDRGALGRIVFADTRARAALEAIVHPEVRRMFADGIQENLDGQRVVVLVNPLLIEMGTHRDCDIVVVVSASIDTQIARSVASGMDESDVRARIAAQLPLAERAQAADVLIDNEGTLDELEDEVDVLWHQLQDRAAAPV